MIQFSLGRPFTAIEDTFEDRDGSLLYEAI